MSRLTAILRRKPVIVAILLAIGVAIPFLTDNTFIIHLLILAFLWGTMVPSQVEPGILSPQSIDCGVKF